MPSNSDSQRPADFAPASEPSEATSPPKRSRKPTRTSSPRREGEAGGPQRLQRVLAAAGFGSRRHCEELIEAGRVEVDGRIADQLGTQVEPQTAKIYVDGSLLKRQKLVYFLLNKPPGVVTTNRDPEGRTRVIDLMQERERVFPVGRLDRSSEGLILMTNDGDLAQQLAHPKYGVRKTYRVTVAGKVDSEKMAQMKKGIFIAEGRVSVDGAKILRHRAKATELEIILREGKNREIRRILARLGHKVLTLQRVGIGPLRLGELPRGAYRPLSSQELKRLREEVLYQQKSLHQGEREGGASAGEAKAPRPAKRSPNKAAHSRPAPTAGKRPGRPPKPPVFEDSKTVGTVIGGEAPPAAEKPRTPRPKRKVVRGRDAASSRTSKGRGAPKGKAAPRGKAAGKGTGKAAGKGKRSGGGRGPAQGRGDR